METPGVFELIDDEHVLLNMGSNKIKIVNLNTMTVVHTFQGKIPHSKDPQVNVINDHQSKYWVIYKHKNTLADPGVTEIATLLLIYKNKEKNNFFLDLRLYRCSSKFLFYIMKCQAKKLLGLGIF